MRPRSALAISLAAGLAVALAASCKKKKEEAGPQAAAAGEWKRLGPKLAGRRAAALRRLAPAPITAEEVKPLIPAVPGAAPIGEPAAVAGGRQVKATLCAGSSSADKTAGQVVAGLEKLGFISVRQRKHPRKPDAITVTAEKPPFRVRATVQRAPDADCSADDGKAKIALAYIKRGGAAGPDEAQEPDEGQAQAGAEAEPAKAQAQAKAQGQAPVKPQAPAPVKPQAQPPGKAKVR